MKENEVGRAGQGRAGQGMWFSWERRKSVQGFGGKTRRKDTIWETRHRWEDGIRIGRG
jgi:hypothetical protein